VIEVIFAYFSSEKAVLLLAFTEHAARFAC
jgi:hypothetical protein